MVDRALDEGRLRHPRDFRARRLRSIAWRHRIVGTEMKSRGLRARRASSAAAFFADDLGRFAWMARIKWRTRVVFDYQLGNLSSFATGNFSEEFESQIQSCRDTRGGPDLAGPDDPTIGHSRRAKAAERRLRPPVRCGALSLEKTGGGQNERARAYRRRHSARVVRLLQPCEQSSVSHRRRRVGLRTWDEDEERVRRFFERVRGADDEGVAISNDGSCAMRHQPQFGIRQQFQNFIGSKRVERGHARIKNNSDLALVGHVSVRAQFTSQPTKPGKSSGAKPNAD